MPCIDVLYNTDQVSYGELVMRTFHILTCESLIGENYYGGLP